jgi:2-polyprenyl-6-methoxyphenol hydroxylase-like FAD-dependent oxidoreductase
MKQLKRTHVLVIGGGPVGLFAAAELVKRGVGVRIVDEEWRGTGFSYALALHPGSMELMEDLELSAPLAEAGFRVETIRFRDGAVPAGELDYTRLDSRYPCLTIVPQNLLEQGLEHWLAQHHTKLNWKHRVTGLREDDDGIEAGLEKWGEDMTGYAVARKAWVIEGTYSQRADLVLGADGHTSTARKHLGLDFEPLGPAERYAVFEFEWASDPGPAAEIVMREDGTDICWPLPGGRCRWSFQVPDSPDSAGERMKQRLSELGHWVSPGLDRDRLEAFIAERAPWFTGGVKDLVWSIPIRFERRLASGFGRGRVWLAGDAAHLAGPAGVHSMNVGFREGRDLADRFQAVIGEDAPLSSLGSYAAERLSEWEGLLNAGGALRATPGASPFARKYADRILSCTPASGRELHALLGQMGLELAPGVSGK